jgi:transcription elongation factor Elf1
MHIDTDQLDGDYPPRPECEINQRDCRFDPVEFTCHQCGKTLCQNCAVGVRHQPQLIKFNRIQREDDERVQMHCPDCAKTHAFDVRKLAAGVAGIVIGAGILALGFSLPTAAVALIAAAVGVGLLYHEYSLKQKLDAEEIIDQQPVQQAPQRQQQ